MMAGVRIWRYDPTRDSRPNSAQRGGIDDHRAVLLAAPDGGADAVAWMALDDYDGGEATVLFAAPPGKQYSSYVRTLLAATVEEAQRLGLESLLAHWQAGWSSATAALTEAHFTETAPGIWRREL
jgi:hypothetical protein